MNVLVQRRLFETVNAVPGLRQFEDPAFHNELELAQQGARAHHRPCCRWVSRSCRGASPWPASLASLLVLSPAAAGLALAAAVPGLIVERKLSGRKAAFAFTMSPHMRRRIFYGLLQTDDRAAKEIRLFGLGDHFLARFLREFRVLNDGNRRMDRAVLHRQLALGAVTGALGAAGLLIVAARAVDGGITTGDVFVAVAAIASIQTSSAGLVGSIGAVLEALLLLGHYNAFTSRVVAAPGEHRPLSAAARRHRAARRVVPLLARPSVGAARGQPDDPGRRRRSRWSGRNGAGKSHAGQAAVPVLRPDRGAILWDGVDLRDARPGAAAASASARCSRTSWTTT